MNTTEHFRHLTRTTLAGAALVLATGGLSAQDAQDDRWLPWTGCWLADEDNAGLLCVQQAEGGVEFLSVGEEGVISDESIIADGRPRPLNDEACEGTTTAEFSPDGERVYLREEVDCDGTLQVSTGLIAMVAPGTWVDIRGLEDGAAVWSRTFQRVTDEFATQRGFPDANNENDFRSRLLRWQASEPSSLNDIIDVYQRTGPGVTKAWVAEQLDPFPVDSDALIALDEAGVPGDVIDIVVAHAFPDKFVLADNVGQQPRRAAESGPRAVMVPTGYGGVAYVGIDPFYNSGYWSPWSYRAFRPFYNSYGWDRWGYGYGGYGFPYRERIIVVRPSTDVPDSGDTYRRARPTPGGGYTYGGSRPSAGTRAGGSTGGASAAPSRGAASVGTRGVAGGRSTGRTAVPRRTGGGGGLF
ncbi:MAG TPA: hypothetical protein VJ925_14715 [Longimicrobiales bacterium]|nr:hypothetical protein [Longimicrobiales bacterium]